MAIAFKPLLEGETLASNVGRYAREVGLTTAYPLCKILWERNGTFNAILPSGLRRLCDEAWDYWHIAPDAFARRHTGYQYHLLLAEPRNRHQALENMLSATGSVQIFSKSASSSLCRGVARHNYCDECLDLLREENIEPYFKVSHQLPGVAVCWVHGTPLRTIDSGFRSDDYALPLALEDYVSRRNERLPGSRRKLHLAAAIDVARRSSFAQETMPQCFVDFPYDELLKDAGLVLPGGKVSQELLWAAFQDYLGKEFCGRYGIDAACVLRRFWRQKRPVAPRPFRFIALQSLLAYRVSEAGAAVLRAAAYGQQLKELGGTAVRPGSTTVRPSSRTKIVCADETRKRLERYFVCRSRFHRAGDHCVGVRVTIRTQRHIFDCSCGSTLSCRFDGDGNAIEWRWVRYGPRYKHAFLKLLREGVLPTTAARKLGLRAEVAYEWKHSCSQWQSTHPVSQAEIEGARRAWIVCMAGVRSGQTLSSVIQANRSTYDFLRLRDGVWLKEFNHEICCVDKARKRNDDYLARLKDAVARLRQSSQPIWLTRGVIQAESGLTDFKIANAPECLEFLNRSVEPRADYIDRVLELSMRTYSGQRPMSLRTFLSRCGGSRLSLNAAQRARVDTWLGEVFPTGKNRPGPKPQSLPGMDIHAASRRRSRCWLR